MTNPTRFTSGLSTAPSWHPLGNYKRPNPFFTADYFTDFMTYAAGDWTVTTSTGSTALAAGLGGKVVQTTSAGANDIQANLKNPAAFAFTAGNQFWFMWRGQYDNQLAALQIGVQAGGTAFAPTDGVYFTKAGATGVVNLNIRKASVSTVVAMTGLTMAAATDYILAFYYDGKTVNPSLQAFAGPASSTARATSADTFNSVSAYFNSMIAAGGPNPTNVLTNLPIVNVAPIIGVQASTAAIRTMTSDYLLASCEVTR